MYEVSRFPLLQWEKGSETPSCDGEKGLRLPRSSCSDLGNEGVSDPFPHRKRESQTLFPTAKWKTPYIPKIPSVQIPLAQRMKPEEFVTLPTPQKNFVNIFSCLPGNFALKNGGDFW